MIFFEKNETISKILYIFANDSYSCLNQRRNEDTDMKKTNFFYRIFDLYYDGFKHMTLGKTLWTIILIKLFIIFVLLKIFFFPNYIKNNAKEGDEAEFVRQQIMQRGE